MKLQIKVIPNASISAIVDTDSTPWKIKVQSPPSDGKANKEVIRLIANYFKVPKSKVVIVSGEKTKIKLLEIFDLPEQ